MVVTKGCTNNARMAVGPTFMSLQPPKKKYIKPSIKPLYKPYCDGKPENETLITIIGKNVLDKKVVCGKFFAQIFSPFSSLHTTKQLLMYYIII